MMKKRTALTFVSLALMYSLLGVFVYFMPLMTDSLTEVADFAVKASSPSYVASQIKETLSCYIIAPDGNDNTTISDNDKQVMNSIIAKDSEDNTFRLSTI